MSLDQIGALLAGHKLAAAGIVILLLSLVQITPLKINPWSAIVNWIRSVFGIKELHEKISKVEVHLDENQQEMHNRIDRIENRIDESQALQARVRILRFGDEIKTKVRHSKESYEQIFDDITRYNTYCTKHPDFKNDMTVITTQLIEDDYKRCFKENCFL